MATPATETVVDPQPQPTPAEPTPTPAAAAPEVTPAPAATPEPTKPESIKDDPFLGPMLKDLGIIIAPVDPEPPKKEPETPPATPEPTKPAEPSEKKIVVKKTKAISEQVEDSVRKVLSEQKKSEPAATATAPAPAAAPAPSADEEFDKTLGEEEQNMLAVAKFAEDNMGKKGAAGEWRGFYKKLSSYIEKIQKDDPAHDFKGDAELAAFIEDNQPWTPQEIRSTERQMLKTEAKTEAKTEVRQETQKEIDEIKDKQRITEFRPVLERALTDLESDIGALIGADEKSPLKDVAKAIGEVGLSKAEEQDPEVTPILRDAVERSLGDASEYLAIARGMREFDPKNDRHTWMASFIKKQGEVFAENGGDQLKRTDKHGNEQTFLPRGKMVELYRTNPDEASKHWTFSDGDILHMLAINTKMWAEKTVKARLEKLEKAGFVRKPAKTAEPVVESPKPTTSPKAPTTTAPGQGKGVVKAGAWSEGELTALGIK